MAEWASVVMGALGFLGMGIGAYAAIRQDLSRLDSEVAQAKKTAERAHERIDGIYLEGTK